jgi:hypothetical protein
MPTVRSDEGFAECDDYRPHKIGLILTKIETELAGMFWHFSICLHDGNVRVGLAQRWLHAARPTNPTRGRPPLHASGHAAVPAADFTTAPGFTGPAVV